MSTPEGSSTALFDHLVIGARDLGAASDWYEQALGFTVLAGGRHTGKGTRNAVMLLESAYLELIEVADEQEARAANRGVLVDYLRDQGDGFVAYAVEVGDIDAVAEGCAKAGVQATGPFPMERVQPDGQVVSWRLLVPGGNQYRTWWPFFIQWDTPFEERFGQVQAAGHRNGVMVVDELSVVVRDLDSAAETASTGFGLTSVGRASRPELAAESAAYQLGGTTLTLLSPTGDGALRETLDTEGEGPLELVLGVGDMAHLRAAAQPGLLTPEPGPDAAESQVDPRVSSRSRLRFRTRT